MADIAWAYGVGVRLLPMSDDQVRTVVTTDAGEVPFQTYLVQRHARMSCAVCGSRERRRHGPRPA